MRKLVGLIKAELPSSITKRIDGMLGAGVAMLLIAPLTLLVYHSLAILLMFMALGFVYTAYSLYRKLLIIREGYKTYLFRVYDYTYVSRSMRSPTGMLMRPMEGDFFEKYHLAVNTKCGLPELGSVIRVYVPGSVKTEIYGDRHYYPQVLGYEVAD